EGPERTPRPRREEVYSAEKAITTSASWSRPSRSRPCPCKSSCPCIRCHPSCSRHCPCRSSCPYRHASPSSSSCPWSYPVHTASWTRPPWLRLCRRPDPRLRPLPPASSCVSSFLLPSLDQFFPEQPAPPRPTNGLAPGLTPAQPEYGRNRQVDSPKNFPAAPSGSRPRIPRPVCFGRTRPRSP